MKKKYKDYKILIILLFTSFFSVYYMSAMLSRLIFLGILVAAFRTRYDYVYLVWFFIINDAPGRLFSGGAIDSIRIPLYPVTAGISVSFEELFLFLYLFKYLNLKNKTAFLFNKEFSSYIVFGVLVSGYSILLGMNFENIVRTFRILSPWCLVFIMPVFIYNRQILRRSYLLLFPIVGLAFFSQILVYFTGDYLESFLISDARHLVFDEGAGPRRSYSAIYLTMSSILMGLYYLFNRKQEINKSYLSLVIFLGFFSIFLSATRGWILALSLIIIGTLVLTGFSKEMARWVQIVFVSTVVFVIVSTQFPIVSKQVEATIHRLQTLESLAMGDVTAERTLIRLHVRGPRVMSKFWQSLFVGWGFSNEYYDYADGHVGHQNILLNVGVLGYVVINGIFTLLCLKIWRMARRRDVRKSEGNAPVIFLLGLVAVFLIHSSSTQFWGFDMCFNQISKLVFWGFVLAGCNTVFLENTPIQDSVKK